MKKETILKSVLKICILVLFSVQLSFGQGIGKVEKYTLKNGLTVILNEDHNQAQIFGVVVCKAGGKDDPTDATGMAHYQEHMLFKGTTKLGTADWQKEKVLNDSIFALYDKLGLTKNEEERKKIQKQINKVSVAANKYAILNEFTKVVKEMGGTDLNANTTFDRTMYFNAFPPNQTEKWLDLYSHRFMEPVFRSFQAELEVVYEEKNMNNDNFFTQLFDEYNKHFYKVHPYGQQTVIGTVEDLKNPSLTKMYKFFKDWYVPNNMALVLVGDFNVAEMKPLIEKYFGRLERRDIPERKVWKEKPFKGREFFEGRYSPIKLGLMGYRVPTINQEDETEMDLIASLFSNENQTGLLDKLNLDNSLLQASYFNYKQNDYASGIFIFVPKIIGQKLDEAENLIHTQIDKLKKGDFDDDLFESVKKEEYKNFKTQLEGFQWRAVQFAEAFGANQDIDKLLSYPDEIKKVTKEDIVRVANKYFGDNYFVLNSKMGKPKHPKIKKPDFEALPSNTNRSSEFANHLSKMTVPDINIKYWDLEKDVKTVSLGNKNVLKISNNPYNDIYTLKIKYPYGELQSPNVSILSDLFNSAGADTSDARTIRKELSRNGASVYFSSNNDYFIVNMEGTEASLAQALNSLNKILVKPYFQKKDLKKVVESEKANRKMEKSEPDNIQDALWNYVKYGKNSPYLRRYGMKELKKLKLADLNPTIQEIFNSNVTIEYIGNTKSEELKKIITAHLKLPEKPIVRKVPADNPVKKYNKNTVFYVNKKSAIQSKINVLVNLDKYNHKSDANIEAYNTYFGGDFFGLAMQEIREYRSYAYGAGGRIKFPKVEGQAMNFNGYMATQADKTIDALSVYDSLLTQMPKKPERIETLRQYLSLSGLTNRPGFRSKISSIDNWTKRGYIEDPAKINFDKFKTLNFDDLYGFYKKEFTNKAVVYVLTSNMKQIDKKELAKFGTLRELKFKDFIKD